jgi:hypothetical protein
MKKGKRMNMWAKKGIMRKSRKKKQKLARDNLAAFSELFRMEWGQMFGNLPQLFPTFHFPPIC